MSISEFCRAEESSSRIDDAAAYLGDAPVALQSLVSRRTTRPLLAGQLGVRQVRVDAGEPVAIEEPVVDPSNVPAASDIRELLRRLGELNKTLLDK